MRDHKNEEVKDFIHYYTLHPITSGMVNTELMRYIAKAPYIGHIMSFKFMQNIFEFVSKTPVDGA